MCVLGSRPWGLDVDDARRVAAELGKYLVPPVGRVGRAKPAEDEPCLRVVLAERCGRCNLAYAAAGEKDNAVSGGSRIRR